MDYLAFATKIDENRMLKINPILCENRAISRRFLMMTEQEIRTKLQQITGLKMVIEKRLWDTALPVKDFNGDELSKENIQQKINEIANQIITNYPDSCPVLISLMDGAMPFASQLHTELTERNYPFQFTCMQVSSYEGTKSGELSMGSLPKILLGNRVVIVVDDVCDTGKTYAKLHDLFLEQGAQEVFLVALVDKVQERVSKCEPQYTGFKISKDAFIIGFGLDYEGIVRNSAAIKTVDFKSLPTNEEMALLHSEASLNEQLRNIIASKLSAPSVESSPAALFASVASKSTQTSEPITLGM